MSPEEFAQALAAVTEEARKREQYIYEEKAGKFNIAAESSDDSASYTSVTSSIFR